MDCTSGGSCGSSVESERWVYFMGRKMFAKVVGGQLKAVTPNRLASESKHYPYGEAQGTPPSDTKDHFATYRRDETGLDYAWNRYYSSTMGRFTTTDPYGGSAKLTNPQSWNRYSYVENNPVNATDRTGMFIDYNNDQSLWFGDGDKWAFWDCLYTPHLSYASWGSWCNPSTSMYSFEMLSLLVPAAAQNMQVSGGGGSSGSGVSLRSGWITTGEAWNSVMTAMNSVIDSIRGDQRCKTWLQGEASDADFDALIDTLLGTDGINRVGVAQIDYKNGSLAALQGGQNEVTQLPSQAVITVNTHGAFFDRNFRVGPESIDRNGVVTRKYRGETSAARNTILIHELAHVFGVILSDFNNPQAVATNESMIHQNCGRVVEGPGRGRR
jgi:RHS repeat-associated protein